MPPSQASSGLRPFGALLTELIYAFVDGLQGLLHASGVMGDESAEFICTEMIFRFPGWLF